MSINIPEYKGLGYLNRNQAFFKDPLLFSYQRQKELGDFFYSRMLLKKIFFVSNVDAIKHILQTNQKNYQKSPAYRQLKLALGNGLITSEGSFWKKQRRLMQPTFYKASLQDLFRTMAKVGKTFCEQLEKRKGSTINLNKEMMAITADMVLATLFTSENKQNIDELYRMMTSAQEYILYRTHNPHLIPFTYINGKHTRFKKDLNYFNQTIFDLIDERKTTGHYPPDLMSMLLKTKDADTGEGMSDQQIRDELITLFAAGHETSANALSWIFYLLLSHNDVFEKIRREIDQQFDPENVSFESIHNLTYTKQVINEAMRMFPPAWAIGRENIAEDKILGCTIPKKSILFISVYNTHFNPKYWNNPESFNPDRFDKLNSKDRPTLAYLPFGAGPRMCIGNHFAIMEMQLILGLLIKKFDFKFAGDYQNLSMKPLVTLKPGQEVFLKLERRKPVGFA